MVRSAHLVQHFRVTSLRLVPRSSLAGVTGIFSASGPRRLVMVTCAGPFDPDRGGYQNLADRDGPPDERPTVAESVLVRVHAAAQLPAGDPPDAATTYWRPRSRRRR